MRRSALAEACLLVSIAACLSSSPGSASDLVWQVENPFRFFKSTRSFALHEAAFNAARGNAAGALPADIIWRTERKLNDPDCKDRSNPDRCAATAGKHFAESRLGWAAKTLDDNCYLTNGNPRRYATVCERKYSWGTAKEDYVLPDAHTVQIWIEPALLTGVTGDCMWAWHPRKAGGKVESRKLACNSKLTIPRVPYSHDHAVSGVSVTVISTPGMNIGEFCMIFPIRPFIIPGIIGMTGFVS